jgi:hypothetical protein
MTDDDTRMDLSALDPVRDPTRLERSASVIAARVAPSLRRRRERPPVMWLELAQWRAPILAAAGLVAVVSIVVMSSPRSTSIAVTSDSPGTLAEAAGVPATVASWVESGTPPSNDALLGVQETP